LNSSADTNAPKVHEKKISNDEAADPSASDKSSPTPAVPKTIPDFKIPKIDAQAESEDSTMVKYEIAKAEYHGWFEVRLAKKEMDDGKDAELKGNLGEGYALVTSGKSWLMDIMKRYPDSVAADEAALLLAGKSFDDRERPTVPKLPVGIKAKEVNVLAKDFDKNIAENRPVPYPSSSEYVSGSTNSTASDVSVPSSSRSSGSGWSGSTGDVYVRGYTRKNGTYVAPHYRGRSSR
jgi:hypothetical protein